MQKIYIIKKQISYILLFFILIYIILNIIPITTIKSYGLTYTYSYSSNDLPVDFDDIYPGYRSLLEGLATSNQNWTFKLYETGLDWETVINSEYQGHGGSPKNLVPSNYSEAWICPICGTRNYDTSGRWYCASRSAIEHTMDPRNTLNETSVFQYLQLSNDLNITKDQVATMASKISYLNDQTLIDAIYEVANNPDYNINPFYIIGKILQEQGSGASSLCSGQGYNGQYVGYYNLFNVGASGNSTEEVILNGLSYAQSKGWDTPQKSIMGGLNLLKTYISRGQNTLYFQKFNVVCSPYYSNQYAQNILDSQSIGSILKGYYRDANLLDSSFTFIIPLYENMPTAAVQSPTVTSQTGEIAHVNANGGLALHSSPNGPTIAYVNNGTQVLITERATEKIGDYYWDCVSTPNGTGYMARESKDGSKTYLVVESGTVPVVPTQKIKIEEETILIVPGITISDIEGATTTSETFGTGAKVLIGENEYTLIMVGDVNGDGIINSGDLLKIQKHLLSVINLNDTIYIKSADANRDNLINSGDLLKIQKYLLKVSNINI